MQFKVKADLVTATFEINLESAFDKFPQEARQNLIDQFANRIDGLLVGFAKTLSASLKMGPLTEESLHQMYAALSGAAVVIKNLIERVEQGENALTLADELLKVRVVDEAFMRGPFAQAIQNLELDDF